MNTPGDFETPSVPNPVRPPPTDPARTQVSQGSLGARGLRGVRDPDLSNSTLATLLGLTATGCLLGLLGLSITDSAWARPGSPWLQSAAIGGSILLLGSIGGAVAKRFGGTGPGGFKHHVWLGAAGILLVTFHSAGNLTGPPALLLLTLAALAGLGWWARTPGAQQMAATFGTKTGAMSPVSQTQRKRLAALIAEKQTLLTQLDPGAEEAVFSLTVSHWLHSPLLARRYQGLVRAERSIVGTDQSVGRAQAYWRRVHQLFALCFAIGLFVHVVTVTFFAGYVAEGREIYWWRIADWSF